MTEMDPQDQKNSQEESTAGQTATGPSIADLFSVLLSNPLSGQGKVLAQLSDQKILMSGSICSLLNVISLFLMILGILRGIFGPFIRMTGGDYFGLFIVCIIPVAALFGGFIILGRLGKTTAIDMQQSLFCAGLTLLPTTVALLISWAWLSTIGMVKVVPFFLVFGLSFSLLLIFGALIDLLDLDEKRAFLMTPTLVAVAMILASIMGSLLM